jgi:hypothetical protein
MAQAQEQFPEAARILRTVPDKNAFYFYRHRHAYSYLGASARSLSELLEQVKTVNVASLEFHSKKGDFANWVQTTIGDATLSREISSFKTKQGEELRNSLIKSIEARLKELQSFN